MSFVRPTLTAADILARRKSYANSHLKPKTLEKTPQQPQHQQTVLPKIDQRQKLKQWMEDKRRRDQEAYRRNKISSQPNIGKQSTPLFKKSTPSSDFAVSRTAPSKSSSPAQTTPSPPNGGRNQVLDKPRENRHAPHAALFTPVRFPLAESGTKAASSRVGSFVGGKINTQKGPVRESAGGLSSMKRLQKTNNAGGHARTPLSGLSKVPTDVKRLGTPGRSDTSLPEPKKQATPSSKIPIISSKTFDTLSPSSKFDHWLKIKGKDSVSTVNHLGCVTPNSQRQLMRQFAAHREVSKSAHHRRTLSFLPKLSSSVAPCPFDESLRCILEELKQGRRVDEAEEILRKHESGDPELRSAYYWLCRAHQTLRRETVDGDNNSFSKRCQEVFDVVVSGIVRDARPVWELARGVQELTLAMAKCRGQDGRTTEDVDRVCDEVGRLSFEETKGSEDVKIKNDIESSEDGSNELKPSETKDSEEDGKILDSAPEKVSAVEDETELFYKEKPNATFTKEEERTEKFDVPIEKEDKAFILEREGKHSEPIEFDKDKEDPMAYEKNNVFTKHDDDEIAICEDAVIKEEDAIEFDTIGENNLVIIENEQEIPRELVTFIEDSNDNSILTAPQQSEIEESNERNEAVATVIELPDAEVEWSQKDDGQATTQRDVKRASYLAQETETNSTEEVPVEVIINSAIDEKPSEKTCVPQIVETLTHPLETKTFHGVETTPFEYDLEDISDEEGDVDDEDRSLTDVSRDVETDESEDKENRDVDVLNEVESMEDVTFPAPPIDPPVRSRPNAHLSQPYGSSAVRLLVQPSRWSPWSNGSEQTRSVDSEGTTSLKTVVTPVRRSTRLTPRVKTLKEKRRVVEELEMLSPESRVATVLKPNQAILDISFAQEQIPDNWEDLA